MKKYASVQFEEGVGRNPFTKTYQFLTDIGDLALGDKVVVDTSNGIQIANFVGYDELPIKNLKTFKWIIQKIDMTTHQDRLQKQKKLDALKQKMEMRRKKLEEIQIFEILAKEDDDMKLLLEEYQQLEF